jgi:hypothetical protein
LGRVLKGTDFSRGTAFIESLLSTVTEIYSGRFEGKFEGNPSRTGLWK